MEDVVIILILAAIVGGIVWYLLRARKRGEKCIGCPYAKQCGGHCSKGCGNADSDNKTEHK